MSKWKGKLKYNLYTAILFVKKTQIKGFEQREENSEHFPLPTVWSEVRDSLLSIWIHLYCLNLSKKASVPFLIKKKGRMSSNIYKRKKAPPGKFLKAETGIGKGNILSKAAGSPQPSAPHPANCRFLRHNPAEGEALGGGHPSLHASQPIRGGLQGVKQQAHYDAGFFFFLTNIKTNRRVKQTPRGHHHLLVSLRSRADLVPPPPVSVPSLEAQIKSYSCGHARVYVNSN